MKIAMIGQKGIPATYGGVERHVEELSARLAAMGHEVTAYCRRHYTSPDLTEHRGVRLRVLRSLATKHLDAVSGTARAVFDVLKERHDVVHFHAIGPSLFSFMPRLLGAGATVVATVHALDWQRRKWNAFARWWLRRGEGAAVRFPHRTIVVSKQIQTYLAERGAETIHIPNGVAIPERVPLEELRRFGVEDGRFVLWLGRFVREKRVEDLIAAFARIPGDWRLVLGGELDEGDAYVRELRRQAEADERVVFTGGLYDRAKAEALHHAALVALPSELEGFPIVLLEAMACGRPVVATGLPEHLEVVAPGRNGFVYPPANVDALAETMGWVLDHPAEAAAAGASAAKTAQAYDWDRITEQTLGVYEDALTRKDAP